MGAGRRLGGAGQGRDMSPPRARRADRERGPSHFALAPSRKAKALSPVMTKAAGMARLVRV